MESSVSAPSRDEQRLAELGYKQTLNRAWSGFSNFAISFTIISILAGCFTTYGQAWNNGGPIAISIGWPLISIPILIIGFCMSELVSAYPTAGGIYWWAGKLGGPIWAWFTGWFNLIGLVAVVASVDYACATFLNVVLGLYEVNIFGVNFGDEAHILSEVFLLFALILILHTAVNVRRTHMLSLVNSVSVWWHVIGVAAIVVVLIVVPDGHQSFSFVFGHRINSRTRAAASVSSVGSPSAAASSIVVLSALAVSTTSSASGTRSLASIRSSSSNPSCLAPFANSGGPTAKTL